MAKKKAKKADRNEQAKAKVKLEQDRGKVIQDIFMMESTAVGLLNQAIEKEGGKMNVLSSRIAGRLDNWALHVRLLSISKQLNEMQEAISRLEAKP